ncbi:hypothetical protein ACMYYO_03280 [Dermacoccaceae bacterium W4C1]
MTGSLLWAALTAGLAAVLAAGLLWRTHRDLSSEAHQGANVDTADPAGEAARALLLRLLGSLASVVLLLLMVPLALVVARRDLGAPAAIFVGASALLAAVGWWAARRPLGRA